MSNTLFDVTQIFHNLWQTLNEQICKKKKPVEKFDSLRANLWFVCTSNIIFFVPKLTFSEQRVEKERGHKNQVVLQTDTGMELKKFWMFSLVSQRKNKIFKLNLIMVQMFYLNAKLKFSFKKL